MKQGEAPNLLEGHPSLDNSYARTIMAIPSMLAKTKFNNLECCKERGYQTNHNF